MQSESVKTENCPYNGRMTSGRPAKTNDRSDIGKRLYEARQNAGLSQIQTAELIGVPQQTYAGWERKECAINPVYLVRLAEIFEVTVDSLLGANDKKLQRGGPKGKAKRLFEELTVLPRSKQNRILSVVEDLIAANKNG
jgi:transcriptional regulator with XRE-family HTH domain